MTAYKFLRRAPTVVHHKRSHLHGVPKRFDTMSPPSLDNSVFRDAVRSVADPVVQSVKSRNR
jgi:hypothetical protein